jgi:hypothetical protein
VTTVFDVGFLVNEGRHRAWGLTYGVLGYQAPDPYGGQYVTSRGAGKARFRQWLDDDVAFDVGVGGGRFGGVGEIALEYRDIIALSAGVNTVPTATGHDVAANVGVRLGSEAIGYLLLALLAAGSNGH